jgi:hypothetical protein
MASLVYLVPLIALVLFKVFLPSKRFKFVHLGVIIYSIVAFFASPLAVEFNFSNLQFLYQQNNLIVLPVMSYIVFNVESRVDWINFFVINLLCFANSYFTVLSLILICSFINMFINGYFKKYFVPVLVTLTYLLGRHSAFSFSTVLFYNIIIIFIFYNMFLILKDRKFDSLTLVLFFYLKAVGFDHGGSFELVSLLFLAGFILHVFIEDLILKKEMSCFPLLGVLFIINTGYDLKNFSYMFLVFAAYCLTDSDVARKILKITVALLISFSIKSHGFLVLFFSLLIFLEGYTSIKLTKDLFKDFGIALGVFVFSSTFILNNFIDYNNFNYIGIVFIVIIFSLEWLKFKYFEEFLTFVELVSIKVTSFKSFLLKEINPSFPTQSSGDKSSSAFQAIKIPFARYFDKNEDDINSFEYIFGIFILLLLIFLNL